MKKSHLTLIIIFVIVLFSIVAYFQSRKKMAEEGSMPTEQQVDSTVLKTPSQTSTGEEQKMNPKSNPNPDLSVDEKGLSRATAQMRTSKGVIKFKFYPEDAPNTVKRFVELIQQGFYNGLTFHRVVPKFVVQGGDPLGSGMGGSGQNLKAEFNQRKHLDGTLAMARAADPDSADSQFYFTIGPQPHLDNNYTVFGQTIEGLDVIRKIDVGDKIEWVWIE